jgi:hypothetical protein
MEEVRIRQPRFNCPCVRCHENPDAIKYSRATIHRHITKNRLWCSLPVINEENEYFEEQIESEIGKKQICYKSVTNLLLFFSCFSVKFFVSYL